MTPAPPDTAAETILAGSTELEVRPIEPSDRDALLAAFERLSPESRYRRFFSPLTELSDRDLTYLTEVDHTDHEALVAVEPEKEEIVGVARYVRTEGTEAEASIVVADDWQQLGIATQLLERLAQRARAAGITHFVALVLAENRDAIGLFEHLARDDPERRIQPGYIELLLELPESGRMRDTPLARALREAARGVVTMNPWSVLAEAIKAVRQGRPPAIRARLHNRPGR